MCSCLDDVVLNAPMIDDKDLILGIGDTVGIGRDLYVLPSELSVLNQFIT